MTKWLDIANHSAYDVLQGLRYALPINNVLAELMLLHVMHDLDVALRSIHAMDVHDVFQCFSNVELLLIRNQNFSFESLVIGQVHHKQLHVSDGALNRLQSLTLTIEAVL